MKPSFFPAGRLSLGLALPLALSGCLSSGGGSSNNGTSPGGGEPPEQPSGFIARFDPQAGSSALPFPTNLAFAGTTDGTLNLPTEGLDPASLAMVNALNDLDGWSTVAPLEVRFSAEVDASSLSGNLQVLRTTLASPATAQLLTEAAATYAAEGATAAITLIDTAVASNAHQPLSGHQIPLAAFTCAEPVTDQFAINVAATAPDTVLLKPLTPLGAGDELDCLEGSGVFYNAVISASTLGDTAFSNGYQVVVFNGLDSLDAEPVVADATYAALLAPASDNDPAALSGLRALYQPAFAVLEGAGIDPAQTVLSFFFSTQSIGHAFDHIKANAQPRSTNFTQAPVPLPFNVYLGRMQDVPYYLNNKPANIGNAAAPTTAAEGASVLTGQWTGANGQGVNRFAVAAGNGPVANQQVDIPVLLTIPAGVAPANGWPVIIYQHGLGSNRSAGLGLAPQFAAQGWAMIAIDHPLHGVLPSDDLNWVMDPSSERHFYLDMSGDGQLDASGAHATPVAADTTRDIRRQTVADLLHLLASLQGIDADGHQLNPDRVGYVGISMGGVIGSMLAGVASDQINAFTLNVPGGGMAKMFDGSPVFAAQSRPAYAEQGLAFGTKAYEDYFNLSQTVQDSGDPINYVRRITAGPAAIQLMEMVGSLDGNAPDLILPNDLMNGPIYSGIFSALGLSEIQVAETAPLSGTTPLWTSMGLSLLNSGSASEDLIRRAIRFNGGSHFSLHLDDRRGILPMIPVTSGVETREAVQRMTVQFLTSEGTSLSVLAQEEQLLSE